MKKKKTFITDEKTATTDFRYFDMNGDEVLEGDSIKHVNSDRIEKIYLTVNRELGTDATNPHWIEIGRAIPCEYGIYPLTEQDLVDAIVVKSDKG